MAEKTKESLRLLQFHDIVRYKLSDTCQHVGFITDAASSLPSCFALVDVVAVVSLRFLGGFAAFVDSGKVC